MDKTIILVDAYGVFNFGQGISKPVIETFAKWIKEGRKVYILSNTTANNEGTVKSYAKKGVEKGKHYTDVMTSGQFAYEDIQAGNLPVAGNKYYLFGTANFKNPDPIPAIFKGSHYERVDDVLEADFIYCGIPQIKNAEGELLDTVNSFDFAEELGVLVSSNKPMVVANPDMRANEGGRFVVRQGTIGQMFQDYGGKVIYYGKPDPRIYDALLQRYCPEANKKDVVMIGDTCRTDIKGAHLAGIEAVLTVEGGVTEYEMQKFCISLDDYIYRQEPIARPDEIWDRVSKEPLF